MSAQDGRRALQPAALWLHSEEGRTRAKASELAEHIEPVLKAVDWSGGTAEDFLGTIRDESGLLTGWDIENYGFMHLGFQEYMAAREIRLAKEAGFNMIRPWRKPPPPMWLDLADEVGVLTVGSLAIECMRMPVETSRHAFAYVFSGKGKFCNASGPLAVRQIVRRP